MLLECAPPRPPGCVPRGRARRGSGRDGTWVAGPAPPASPSAPGAGSRRGWCRRASGASEARPRISAIRLAIAPPPRLPSGSVYFPVMPPGKTCRGGCRVAHLLAVARFLWVFSGFELRPPWEPSSGHTLPSGAAMQPVRRWRFRVDTAPSLSEPPRRERTRQERGKALCSSFLGRGHGSPAPTLTRGQCPPRSCGSFLDPEPYMSLSPED
jgi:hypothetical protein